MVVRRRYKYKMHVVFEHTYLEGSMGLLKHNSLEFSGAVPSTSDVVMLKPHLRIGGTSQFLSLEVERLRSLPTFLLHERISNGRGRGCSACRG